jgi:hypothetical protein
MKKSVKHIPYAHIAAPIRLETVNTRPIIGRPSRRAAANPNAMYQNRWEERGGRYCEKKDTFKIFWNDATYIGNPTSSPP